MKQRSAYQGLHFTSSSIQLINKLVCWDLRFIPGRYCGQYTLAGLFSRIKKAAGETAAFLSYYF
jgi:hypothetical protein